MTMIRDAPWFATLSAKNADNLFFDPSSWEICGVLSEFYYGDPRYGANFEKSAAKYKQQ